MYMDLWSALARIEMQVSEAQSQAEFRDLLRQAGMEQPGWLSWQGRQLAHQLGHRLVVLGKRLERYGLPQPSL